MSFEAKEFLQNVDTAMLESESDLNDLWGPILFHTNWPHALYLSYIESFDRIRF